MGYVGSKTRSLGQISLKPCSTSRGHSFFLSSWNFTRMFNLMISQSVLNMGHVGLKTRSLRQISLKPYSFSRGHSFALTFKDFNQNVYIDDILFK